LTVNLMRFLSERADDQPAAAGRLRGPESSGTTTAAVVKETRKQHATVW
jgi:hypothetical protein